MTHVKELTKQPACVTNLNGVCITKSAFKPEPLTNLQCQAEFDKGYMVALKELPLPCFQNDDYWAGAMKACNDIGSRLANEDEMKKLLSSNYSTISRTQVSAYAVCVP